MKDFLIQNYATLIGGFVGLCAIIFAWFKAIQKTKADLRIARIEKNEATKKSYAKFLKDNPQFGHFSDSDVVSLDAKVQKIEARIQHLESINRVLNFWKIKSLK